MIHRAFLQNGGNKLCPTGLAEAEVIPPSRAVYGTLDAKRSPGVPLQCSHAAEQQHGNTVGRHWNAVHMEHGLNSRFLQGKREEEANSGQLQLSFTDVSLGLSLEQVEKKGEK